MIPRLVEATYVGDYNLYLRFSNGTDDEINFDDQIERMDEAWADILFQVTSRVLEKIVPED